MKKLTMMMVKDILTRGLLSGLLLAPVAATAQGVIEIRDPLRGVTYYSLQLSADTLSRDVAGISGMDDTMTVGISALLFDGSGSIDEYVLWFHHNGPRLSFTETFSQPLMLKRDESTSHPDRIRVSRLDNGEGMLTEKIEFRLSSREFTDMMTARHVEMVLSTVFGDIVKTMTAEDLSVLRRFDARLRNQQNNLQAGLSSQIGDMVMAR